MTHAYLFILFAGMAVGVFNGTIGALAYNGREALWIGLALMVIPALGMAWAY